MSDNSCGYSTEWQPYKNDYDKLEYDVKLKDGTIVCNCYPNAGFFNSMGGGKHDGKKFSEEDVEFIRITPFDQQKININEDEIYSPFQKQKDGK